jgi:hypothetical protein
MERTALDSAFEQARQLPEAVQDVLAEELVDRIEALSRSGLSVGQADEIRQRLAAEPVYAAEAAVRAFYARFGIAR